MRIAIAQTHIIWEDKHSNIIETKRIIESQAKNRCDLFLFPEMSFTGFSMNTAITQEANHESLSAMRDLAKEKRIAIGFGWVEKNGDKCRNNYTVINCKGDIVSSYAKIHPFSYSEEDKYFSGGDKIVTFSLEDVEFGTFICYDLRFPELFRTVVDRVHAIVIPANWPAKRAEHWKTLLRARAIENQVYIFAANCVGNIGGQYYSGDSCVINPNGDIEEMISDKEGVINYDFYDNVHEIREEFPVLNDRRFEVYKQA